MEALLSNPLLIGAAVLAVLIVGLLAAKYLGNKEQQLGSGVLPGMDELLKNGQYLQAGMLAQKNEKYEQAIEYFLRAQEPLRAAQMAARTGNTRRAAELYERAGDLRKAIHLYEQAGLTPKADALREKLGDQVVALEPEKKRGPEAEAPASDPEKKFRKLQAAAGNDAAARARLQEAGIEAAEHLLRQGEIRKAAEIYRDADMIDEAIHLYVNVLGAPGEAAPLVAARGNHERAAELYEMAGKLERAAELWIGVAKKAPRPEIYIDRIEGLAPQRALQFLEEASKERPLAKDTAELHYRFALAVEKSGEAKRAIELFQQMSDLIGDYKDVDKRILTLRSAGNAKTEPSLEEDFPPPPSLSTLGTVARKLVEHDRVSGMKEKGHASPQQLGLSAAQVSAIAQQAVKAALEQATRGGLFPPIPSPAEISVVRANRANPPRVYVVGLEQEQVELDGLHDPAIHAAQDGPSIESLRQYVGNRACDLQNIEVFYRMGLAHLANGQWSEALEAFDAVEEASPGYRDADKRATRIRDWKNAVGPRISLMAKKGTTQNPAQSGRYRVHGELGRGGMAVVYRATDEVLGRDVALKFLSDELMSSKEMRDMFEREAKSVAQLNHPNIVTIYDFGTLEGKTFICMEFVEGAPLENLIDQRGKLAIVEALRVTVQILDALDYAHGQGIIHRDIKPSNMMRAKSGLVKLMDFGLAKSIAQGSKASIIAGTPAYMPPEQFTGGAVDHRADIFAVGCSLYEMLTGQLPFEGADRSRPAISLRKWDDTLPEALEKIIAASIELSPEARYGSARDFATPIKDVLHAVDRYTSRGESLGAMEADEFDPTASSPIASMPTSRLGVGS